VPQTLQGVTRQRIRRVLREIAHESEDIVDLVFALLDDQQPSWFPKAPAGTRFSDGATTAQLFCHVGILQRGRRKIDRESRDFMIKPLRDVGAIEAVTFDSKRQMFVAGHTTSKSQNSAYRLADDFKALLQAPEEQVAALAHQWIAEDATRRRLELQARAAVQALSEADTKHRALIHAACDFYVPHFLRGYKIIYIDDSDGTRIPDDARARLREFGVELRLEDPMPDVLLGHHELGAFWVIEAVTSDGEVDLHKVKQVKAFIQRTRPEAKIGFTTAYRTWRDAATRQAKAKNLAPDTYLWIQEDASKHFRAESIE
jgi:hypothetical protein